MRRAGDDRHGLRLRVLIAVLWRGGLGISEALALYETDVDERCGSLRIRHCQGTSAARRDGSGYLAEEPRVDRAERGRARSGLIPFRSRFRRFVSSRSG